MKPDYIAEIEDLDLERWRLIEDSSTFRVYQKDGIEKQLQIYENYSVEENYKDGKLHGPLIGRMKEAFQHFPDYESKIYLIEHYVEDRREGVFEDFSSDCSRIRQEWKNDQLNGKCEAWFGNG